MTVANRLRCPVIGPMSDVITQSPAPITNVSDVHVDVTATEPWARYTEIIDSAPGTELIGTKAAPKEWREGFGGLLTDTGTHYTWTGARVDDNGTCRIVGGGPKGSYDIDRHHDLLHVFRSLELQSHFATVGTAATDPVPLDSITDWGFDDQAWTDPGEVNENTTRVILATGNVGFTHCAYIIQIRGDENQTATATVRYRRVGETTWRTALDSRVYHPTPLAAHDLYPRHCSGVIFRLCPNTAYEAEVIITDADGVAEGPGSTQTTRTIPITFKTRSRTRPSKTGTTYTPSTAAAIKTLLGVGEAATAAAGDTIEIAAGDYSGSLGGADNLWNEITATGTIADPIYIVGNGLVRLPRLVFGSGANWLIFDNVTINNRDPGPNVGQGNESASIRNNGTSTQNIGNVLHNISISWHPNNPQNEADALAINAWPDQQKSIVISSDDQGPAALSVRWWVIENSELHPGYIPETVDTIGTAARKAEWIAEENFDIRCDSLTSLNNEITNIYDCSLGGFNSDAGKNLCRHAYLARNKYFAIHDDWLEIDNGGGGAITVENYTACAMKWNVTYQGYAHLPEYHPLFSNRTIGTPTQIATGEWQVPYISGGVVKGQMVIWQGGKCWQVSRALGGGTFDITDKLRRLYPTDDRYTGTDSPPVAGTITCQDDDRQQFAGSHTFSSQGDAASQPNFEINNQHSGFVDNGSPDTPWKWKDSSTPLSVFGTMATTKRRCDNFDDINSALSMHWTNNILMKDLSGYFDTQFANANFGGGIPQPTKITYFDYDAWWNINQDSGSPKRYLGNKTVADMFLDYGIEEHGVTMTSPQDEILNFWATPNPPVLLTPDLAGSDPNWLPADMAPSDVGTLDPLYPDPTGQLYGAGPPEQNGFTNAMGPFIDSNDTMTIFAGVANKTTDQRDIGPQQYGLGPIPAGRNICGDYIQYQLPTGWTVRAGDQSSLLASLGITTGTGVQRLVVAKTDDTVGLLVEFEDGN